MAAVQSTSVENCLEIMCGISTFSTFRSCGFSSVADFCVDSARESRFSLFTAVGTSINRIDCAPNRTEFSRCSRVRSFCPKTILSKLMHIQIQSVFSSTDSVQFVIARIDTPFSFSRIFVRHFVLVFHLYALGVSH